MKAFQRLMTTLWLLLAVACTTGVTPEKVSFYVGSSDGSLNHSIFLCELDYRTGQVTVVDSFPGSKASSYLALSPDKKMLYAIDGTQTGPQQNYSSVSSFRVKAPGWKLEWLNRQSSEGRGICHVSCHPEGSYIFVANYTEGNIAAFPLGDDGSIMPASDIVQHTGSGPDTRRQAHAHAHCIGPDPAGRYILATDLGVDKVYIYKFDPVNGRLLPNPEQEYFSAEPGAGPRHFAFHPSRPLLFIVNELNGTTNACSYDRETGRIKEINTVSNLPEDAEGPNYPAAVRIHPDGQYVYASNRVGHNSITVFKIGESGQITRIQVMDEVPAHPRDFNIDPLGRFLVVAGQQGNAIEIFRIDADTGRLSRTGRKVQMKAPACVLFME
jgi:6-phosphogluconolactonase